MDWREAVLAQGGIMHSGTVPFVALKSIGWVARCEHRHEPVAGDFRRNRGERDERHGGVPADYRLLAILGRGAERAVEQDLKVRLRRACEGLTFTGCKTGHTASDSFAHHHPDAALINLAPTPPPHPLAPAPPPRPGRARRRGPPAPQASRTAPHASSRSTAWNPSRPGILA